MIPITDLQFIINAFNDSQIQFDPNVRTYTVTVPTDCFGALLKLNFAPEFYISIRADRDAGRFGFESLDPNMGDYIAGSEIPYYEYYGGYIIRLDKRESCFAHDLDVTVTIDAGSTEHGTDRYEIHIHRDSGKNSGTSSGKNPSSMKSSKSLCPTSSMFPGNMTEERSIPWSYVFTGPVK